jgi:hypothetical protein
VVCIIRIKDQVIEIPGVKLLPGIAAIYRPVDAIAASASSQDIKIRGIIWIHSNCCYRIAYSDMRKSYPGASKVVTLEKTIPRGFCINDVGRRMRNN